MKQLIPILITVGVLVFVAWAKSQPFKGIGIAQQDKTILADLGQAPAFKLLDQDANEFDSALLAGKISLVSFFFTSCGGPCPRLNASLAKLQRDLKDTPNIQFVSISIDPKVDTPAVLKKYASDLGVDEKNWRFLTGAPETINQLSRQGFKLGLDEMAMIHSTNIVLVDQSSRIRTYFDALEEKEINNLKSALDSLE